MEYWTRAMFGDINATVLGRVAWQEFYEAHRLEERDLAAD
jgi:hypothetical protein